MRRSIALINIQPKLLIPEAFKIRFQSICVDYGLRLQTQDLKTNLEEEQFRTIELTRKRFIRKPRNRHNESMFKQPREQVQSVTQDWGNVWPGIRSFHPATVPLPVRMGYPNKNEPSPDKWGNSELMKIPNFLHVTPPVIERQCAALKQFCTPWPAELEDEAAQSYHFPVTVITSSYLHSSPSIRDLRARIVTLKVAVDSLALERRALDKLLRLVGERFDPKARMLTLVADRCPISDQNRGYCTYLLNVIYSESVKTEPWEHERGEDDCENFTFEASRSEAAVAFVEVKSGSALPEAAVRDYGDVVTRIHNQGEDTKAVEEYKNAVLKILNLA